MQIKLNEQGFIDSFAIEGELVDGLELPDPVDIDHFTEHFGSYMVRDPQAKTTDILLGCLSECLVEQPPGLRYSESGI